MKGCHHCHKLQQLYPEREYNPKTHIKQNCPILAETKCYNCGEIGHTPKYCKLPKTKCIYCGRIGHTADVCENIEEESSNNITLDKNPTSWIIMNKMVMNFENIE